MHSLLSLSILASVVGVLGYEEKCAGIYTYTYSVTQTEWILPDGSKSTQAPITKSMSQAPYKPAHTSLPEWDSNWYKHGNDKDGKGHGYDGPSKYVKDGYVVDTWEQLDAKADGWYRGVQLWQCPASNESPGIRPGRSSLPSASKTTLHAASHRHTPGYVASLYAQASGNAAPATKSAQQHQIHSPIPASSIAVHNPQQGSGHLAHTSALWSNSTIHHSGHAVASSDYHSLPSGLPSSAGPDHGASVVSSVPAKSSIVPSSSIISAASSAAVSSAAISTSAIHIPSSSIVSSAVSSSMPIAPPPPTITTCPVGTTYHIQNSLTGNLGYVQGGFSDIADYNIYFDQAEPEIPTIFTFYLDEAGICRVTPVAETNYPFIIFTRAAGPGNSISYNIFSDNGDSTLPPILIRTPLLCQVVIPPVEAARLVCEYEDLPEYNVLVDQGDLQLTSEDWAPMFGEVTPDYLLIPVE